MNQAMKRRDFLLVTAAAAGSALAGAGPVRAEGPAAKWVAYEPVEAGLFQGINRVKDPASETALEQKHVPVIDAPETVKAGETFSVQVSIGEALHPMIPQHYIHWVELFAGNEPAGRVGLTPTFGVPQVTLRLKLDKSVTLVVREYCNLHGLWESRKDIQVS